MFDNLRGVVAFEAEGNNIYSFLDAVREAKIGCRRQKNIGGKISAETYLADYPLIAELARQNGVSINIAEKRGRIFGAMKYRKRLGFLFGIFAAAAISVYMSNRVVRIEINGCETLDSGVVLAALEDCGIQRGAFIPSLNFESCQRKLMLSMNEIAWAGIRNTGGRIVVDIDETVFKPEMVEKNTPCNIVAAADGVVLDIRVLDGVTAVSVGDAVKKGDVIISGVQINNKGGVSVKHALGEVKGAFSRRVSFECPLSSEATVETGKVRCCRSLSLFSLDVPLFISRKTFDSCSVGKSESPLMIFGAQLPVSLTNYEYRETVSIPINRTAEEAQNVLEEKKRLYESNFLGEYTILSQQSNFVRLDDRSILEVEYSLEGEMGIKSEILLKNLK